MREHPILFSTEMVRAIRDGRKTMTRRVIKPQPTVITDLDDTELEILLVYKDTNITGNALVHHCPYGQIGDRLWVRERIRNCMEYVAYPSDGYIDKSADWVWKNNILPSFYMPKGLARIWLEITNIRVERLQDITSDDAIAEGMDAFCDDGIHDPGDAARVQFRNIWDRLNGKTYPWAVNPWVWVIEFKKLESVK